MIAAASLMAFAIVNPRAFPVLAGQKWNMPGVGIITIIKVQQLGKGFDSISPRLNVMYQLVDGSYGFCERSDLRNFGKLLPYSHKISSQKRREINKIIQEIRKQKISAAEYNAPKKKSTIQDAEIILEHNAHRAINQYKRVMSYGDRFFRKD